MSKCKHEWGEPRMMGWDVKLQACEICGVLRIKDLAKLPWDSGPKFPSDYEEAGE